MTTNERTLRPRPAMLVATGFVALCVPATLAAKESGAAAASSAEGSPPDVHEPTDEASDGPLSGFRIGTALGVAQRQVVAENPWIFTPGVLAEARVGAALGPTYVTGAGVRGTWSVLAVKDLKVDSGTRARDLQLIDATAYWFHQWDFSAGSTGGVRLALGPHLSLMLADGDVLGENPLIGGELSLEFRVLRGALQTNWSSNLWLGLSASHAFENGSTETPIDNQDRETSAKILVAFDVEQK